MQPAEEEPEKKRTGCGRGCLVEFLFGLALTAYSVCQMGEQGRRAERIHQSIKPGMDCTTVEQLLTGRYDCVYEIGTAADWKTVPRDEFVKAFGQQTNSAPVSLQLKLTFLGMSPGHLTFYVEIDAGGKVVKVTPPVGWD